MAFLFGRFERTAAAGPVLKRGRRGLARQNAHLGIEATADVARVDGNDLPRFARLRVPVEMKHKPGILERRIVRHVGIRGEGCQNRLLQLLVLAEGLLAFNVGPLDMVDVA